jgi:hypothetical protein
VVGHSVQARLRAHVGALLAGEAGGLPALGGGVRLYERWNRRGLPQLLAGRLRAQVPVGFGHDDAEPTAAVVDSQTVKAADTVGVATRGFDSGKNLYHDQAGLGRLRLLRQAAGRSSFARSPPSPSR